MRSYIILMLFLAVLLSACDRPETGPAEKVPAKPTVAEGQIRTEPHVSPHNDAGERTTIARVATATLFRSPIEPVIVELPAEALAFWRSADGQPVPLVLFSMSPFLQPVPETLRERARNLVKSGSRQDLHNYGSINRVAPVVLTQQFLSAAIDAGMIEQILWFFPFQEPIEALDLNSFREQIVKAGFLEEGEAAQFALKNGVFSGTARGIPLRIVHPAAYLAYTEDRPRFPRPPVVHVDLGYLRGMYVDPVKTPLYQVLFETVALIKEMSLRPRTVTLAPRTEEKEISLDARFLIHDFARMIREPSLLTGEMPAVWQLRTEALQLNAMMQKEESWKVTMRAAEQAPSDPCTLYDLFSLQMKSNRVDEALATLKKVVHLEPGYAFSYLELATFFVNNQQFDVAAPMLQTAQIHYPDNPFILVNQAQLHLAMQEPEKARPMLEKLQKLPWSPVYHAPALPGLEAMLQQLPERKKAG